MQGKRKITEAELKEELREKGVESDSDSDAAEDDSVDGPRKPRRGRPKQAVVWSRLLKIKEGEPVKLAEHNVFVDVALFL
jgi:hypothetical protein